MSLLVGFGSVFLSLAKASVWYIFHNRKWTWTNGHVHLILPDKIDFHLVIIIHVFFVHEMFYRCILCFWKRCKPPSFSLPRKRWSLFWPLPGTPCLPSTRMIDTTFRIMCSKYYHLGILANQRPCYKVCYIGILANQRPWIIRGELPPYWIFKQREAIFPLTLCNALWSPFSPHDIYNSQFYTTFT